MLMMKLRWFLPRSVIGLLKFKLGVRPSLLVLCYDEAAIDLDLPSKVTLNLSLLPFVSMWLWFSFLTESNLLTEPE